MTDLQIINLYQTLYDEKQMWQVITSLVSSESYNTIQKYPKNINFAVGN